MDVKPQLPTALKVVAILFILYGINSILEILYKLTHSYVSINLGVLGIFIGRGLFQLRPGWRTCALVFTWFSLILFPILMFFTISHSGPIPFEFFGQKIGYVSKELTLVFEVIIFVLTIWQYRILTRPDVRTLFGIQDKNVF